VKKKKTKGEKLVNCIKFDTIWIVNVLKKFINPFKIYILKNKLHYLKNYKNINNFYLNFTR